MKLSLADLKNTPAGYNVPGYDVALMREKTLKNPAWLHFGPGNIFRMYPALMQQKLLNEGITDTGILVCEGYDEEIIEEAFKPNDNLCIAVTLKSDGKTNKDIVGSIAESYAFSSSLKELKEIFSSPSLQMVSFTITEKGYAVKGSDGEYTNAVKADMENSPEKAVTLMGRVAALCLERAKNTDKPLALVSMDNCSNNGDKLKAAVTAFCEAWLKNGKTDTKLPESYAFPLTMIDKITPRPSGDVLEAVKSDGFEGIDIIKTQKNTYISAIVNAEEAGYLVIEDIFPNGRPSLEKAGAIFTSRETVGRVEKMKVCTCLNPLHTALSVFGMLLGYTSVSKASADPELEKLIRGIGLIEGMPAVVHPGIIDPADFINEVLEKRFPNPFIPDSPQRIAEDTSQKIPVRFGETLKAYVKNNLDISKLEYIPLFIAGWLRYLLGADDKLEAMTLSPDPLLNELTETLKPIKPGSGEAPEGIVMPILKNKAFFGVDLEEVGLSGKVLAYFARLNAGQDAVRNVLREMK